MIEAAGIEKPGVWCPALKRMELHPWQWTPKGHPSLTTPTLIQSLRALRPQLTLEIKKGFKTSPFRVCRLAYRTAIVYVLAALSWLPGRSASSSSERGRGSSSTWRARSSRTICACCSCPRRTAHPQSPDGHSADQVG